jgi:hypothetical protein
MCPKGVYLLSILTPLSCVKRVSSATAYPLAMYVSTGDKRSDDANAAN